MARKRLSALQRWAEQSRAIVRGPGEAAGGRPEPHRRNAGAEPSDAQQAECGRLPDEGVTAAPVQAGSDPTGRDALAPIDIPAELGPDSPAEAAVARAKWLPLDPASPQEGDSHPTGDDGTRAADSPPIGDDGTRAADRWLIE
jgi:hypothetical protein